MSDADELAAKRLLSDLAQAKEQSAFLGYQPMWYQRDWLSSRAKFVFLTTGNRLGKSTTGAVKALIEATGVWPPSLTGTAPPRAYPIGSLKGKRILICGETMRVSVRDTILPKLREFLAPAMLIPGARAIKKNPQTGLEEIFRFRSGCEVVIGSYDQPVKSYEGTRWDFVWLDEPPPDEFLRAIVRGTIDHSAQIFLSATPLNCGFIWDEYVEPSQDENNPLHGMVEHFKADIHWNCVLPGTRIGGRITGALRASYSGEAVEVESEHGDWLRVTINHPVLTTRGIVRAGDLRQGDKMLRQGGEIGFAGPLRDVDHQDRPDATAEEVFEALARERGMASSNRLAFDLDGDQRSFVADGEVDLVGSYLLPLELPVKLNTLSETLELRTQGDLVFPDVASPTNDRRPQDASTPRGPGGRESALDGGTIPTQAAPFGVLRLGGAAHLDAEMPKAALQSVDVAASFAGELLEGFPGLVSTSEVRYVRHFDYLGHVYDFATEVGYFASDNLLSRNCRECHGGYLPHKEIMAYLATLPPQERAARERGEFSNMSNVEFSEFSDGTHVVPDLWGPGAANVADPDPARPETWPTVCVVDPSTARGLHAVYFTFSPRDVAFVTAAEVIPVGGIAEMAEGLRRIESERLPSAPVYRIMDVRGGAAVVDIAARDDFFRAFGRVGLTFVPSKTEELRQSVLHDWLKPAWNPVTERMEARMYFTRSVAQQRKGPVWALRRYVWNPEDTVRKRFTQPGKDYVDCLRYLALQPGMTWRNLSSLAQSRTGQGYAPAERARQWSITGAIRPQNHGNASVGLGRTHGLPRQSAPSRRSRPELW